ncbi:MAG TPA: cellulose synthase operon protein YhjQ/BcsQ [Chroococcales cyanobacterium]
MQPFRILFLAEDSLRDMYRGTIRQSYQLIGETADFEAGVFLGVNLKADLVILGYGYSLDRALAAAEAILVDLPTAAIVLMGDEIGQEDLVRVMQGGIREFLPNPAPEDLTAAIRRAHLFHERLNHARGGTTDRHLGKVLVVHSPRGGSGKSFFAANLAIALHQLFRQEVALVDLALPFGGQDLLLNLPAAQGRGFADLAAVSSELDFETAFGAMHPHGSGIHFLPAPATPEEAEGINPSDLEPVFQVLKGHYGWVVVDSNSELNELNLKLLEIADRVVVPFFPEMIGLRHIQRALRIWEQLGVNCGKIEFCRWEQKSEVGEISAEKVFKKAVAHHLPYDPVGALDSINQGIPLILLQQNCPLSKAMREMAASLTGAVSPISSKSHRLIQFWHMIRRLTDVSA